MNSEKKLQPAAREQFPHIRNGYNYLNHAAISPLSDPVRQAMEKFLFERSAGPVENFEQWKSTAGKCKDLIRDLVHARSSDQIAFTSNTSEGISLVAEGLPWREGDEIILNDMEFPANVQPFRALSDKGVRLHILESVESRIEPDQIENSITPATRMISISAVQYIHGFRANLEAIGEICRRNNLWFVVDGIQALGAISIDVEKAGIDALAGGGHKWLMAPMGTGFLYLSDKLLKSLRPARTGWLSVENPMEMRNYEQNWVRTAGHYETGTSNMAGITGLFASLRNLQAIGSAVIESKIESLATHAVSHIQQSDGMELISPAEVRQRAGIVTFRFHEDFDDEDVVTRLGKEKIIISSRDGIVRISPHYYNEMSELDHLFTRLSDIKGK